jgi:hypothetical protein
MLVRTKLSTTVAVRTKLSTTVAVRTKLSTTVAVRTKLSTPLFVRTKLSILLFVRTKVFRFPSLLASSVLLNVRVARWFVFKPKIPIWVNFVGP